MPYTIVMKLEQVLPMLRDGKTITRTKPYNDKNTVVFVKLEDYKLKFKLVFTTGEIINWAYYTLKTEDVMADNWEIAE
jgi:hypothetical protein